MKSETWLSATRMPHGQNNKVVIMNAVVDKVANAGKVQPTNTFQSRITDLDSSAGLAKQQYERAFEIRP